MESIVSLNDKLAYCSAKLTEANKALIKAYKSNISYANDKISYLAQKKMYCYNIMMECAPTGLKFKRFSLLYKWQCKKIDAQNKNIADLNYKIAVLEREIEEVG